MNAGAWAIAGFAGTLLLTMLLAGSQGLGLTRMNMPYILGTMVTPDRDRAKLIGIVIHLMNGWMFSLIYIAAFHTTGIRSWWFGGLIGLVHGMFVVVVAMPIMPALHPRMASSTHGPTVVRQLEPPGFLGANYGRRTPISVVVAHVIYGITIGVLYRA